MSEFKKCQNGHFFSQSLSKCPYCPENSEAATGADQQKKSSVSSDGPPTVIIGDPNESGNYRPQATPAANTPVVKPPVVRPSAANPNNTVFFTDDFKNNQTAAQAQPQPQVQPQPQSQPQPQTRSARKLVGWLVSYTIDSLGVDFKLYEGRNMIGRGMDCGITVASDALMSAKHATLLFRDNSYAIKDEMSSHGTFVNDESIGFDTCVLEDGDLIKMGDTVFRFKKSL